MSTKTLVSLLLASICAACAGRSPSDLVELHGSLVALGGQVTLYDDEAAARRFDKDKCVDVYISRRQAASMGRWDGRSVSLRVRPIGPNPFGNDGTVGMTVFGGASVTRYCSREAAYLLVGTPRGR